MRQRQAIFMIASSLGVKRGFSDDAMALTLSSASDMIECEVGSRRLVKMKSWLMGERKIWWLLCRGLLLVGLSKGRMIGKKGRMDEQVNEWSGGSCSSFLQGEPMGQKSCCCYCCCRCCAAGYSDNNNNMFTLSSSYSSSSSLFFTSPLPKIMVHFSFFLLFFYLFGFLIFQPCVSFCRRYQMEEGGMEGALLPNLSLVIFKEPSHGPLLSRSWIPPTVTW